MDKHKITCYHEAGHVITSATIGRRVKECSIIGPEEGYTEYFCDNTLSTSPPNTLPDPPQGDEVLSPKEWEAKKQEYYRSQNLEDILMTLAAGTEAALIYSEEKEWDTKQIIEETKDLNTQDSQDMNAYIDAHVRQFERDKLVKNARIDARRVLIDERIWGYVRQIAELLIARGHFEWESLTPWEVLPEKHKQIINSLLRGE